MTAGNDTMILDDQIAYILCLTKVNEVRVLDELRCKLWRNYDGIKQVQENTCLARRA